MCIRDRDRIEGAAKDADHTAWVRVSIRVVTDEGKCSRCPWAFSLSGRGEERKHFSPRWNYLSGEWNGRSTGVQPCRFHNCSFFFRSAKSKEKSCLNFIGILQSDFSYFLDNRINPNYKPPSSYSGVQMIGISQPIRIILVIIAFLIWAFSMYLQFQVNR